MKRQRHPLKRFYGRNDLHFITFSCYRRRPYLGTLRARNRFARILDQVRKGHKFELIGYVQMLLREGRGWIAADGCVETEGRKKL